MSEQTPTPDPRPFDPSAFIVTPQEVHAFLFPMATTLFHPVTDEFDAERGRQMFDEFISNTLMFIRQRVAEQGGTTADYQHAVHEFTLSLEASFRGIQ